MGRAAHPFRSSAAILLVIGFASTLVAQPATEPKPRGEPPTLTVTGTGDSSARPDRAVLVLGAVVQAEQASAAQQRVNEIMQAAIESVRGQGVRDDAVTTVGLTLHPVYTDPPQRPFPQNQPPAEPRIVAYRASNRVRVQLDDLSKIGPVIDAGVQSGANHVEDLSFQLKDDTAARAEALRGASNAARAKADAIAQALGLRIDGVLDAVEGGVHVVRPRMDYARAGVAAAMEASTPVQPGQVEVQASVTVTYRVSPSDGAGRQ